MAPAVVRVFHREYAGRPLRVVWTLEELGHSYDLEVMTYEEGRSAGTSRRVCDAVAGATRLPGRSQSHIRAAVVEVGRALDSAWRKHV
jgi:hypothetical protein